MFTGFQDADFEAYAPAKWRSNVWNRERLGVKEKLLALARGIAPRALAADGSPLLQETSSEHPTQWNHKQVEAQHVFFSRDLEARKHLETMIEKGQSIASLIDDPTPQRNHVFLALTIAHDRLEVGVKLHPDARVDRENLERRITDHFEREKLRGLLGQLPAPFGFGLTGEITAPARTITEPQLLDWVAASKPLPAPAPSLLAPPAQRLLIVGRSFARSEIVGPEDGAARTALLVEQAFVALLPLYHYLAWSRENDFLSIRDTLHREKQSKRQRGLARHDEVRIVRGLLTGKLGVVQDVDSRGGLKILVGSLAVKLNAEDVEKR